MANLPETSNFDANVNELLTTDLVLGGPGGPANLAAQNLTNRTRWLFDQNTAAVAELGVHATHLGVLDGEITGINASITAINANLASINGQLPLLAPIASPAFTGTPTAPTPPPGNNSTRIATTAALVAAVAGLAALASPAFTGTPTAPTAAVGTATTQLATTAFVNPGSSFGTSNYRKNPDGSIHQWGRITVSGTTTLTFPVAFPTACRSCVLTNISSTNQINISGTPSTTQAVFTNGSADVFWEADGN